MPVVRTVEVWPPVGDPEELWVPDVDVDALARTAGGVCELYSRELAGLGLQGPRSTLRVFLWPTQADPDDDLVVTVSTDLLDGNWETAAWTPPRGLREQPPPVRRQVVLDAVHATVRSLAGFRGWDVDALDAVHDRLAGTDLVLLWASPWKSAPSLRHRARVRFAMRPDGFGDAVLEIDDARTRDVVASSASALAYCSLPGWQRAASTLRWDGSAEVSLLPYVDTLARTRGDLTLRIDAGLHAPALVGSTPGGLTGDVRGDVPRVVVRRHPFEEEGPQIRVVGGGPMNDVPPEYERELDRLLGELQGSDAWLRWWAGADRDVLELWYDFEPTVSGPLVRTTKRAVRATIRRRTPEIRASADPGSLARQDVAALTAAVTRIKHLPAPPAWR